MGRMKRQLRCWSVASWLALGLALGVIVTSVPTMAAAKRLRAARRAEVANLPPDPHCGGVKISTESESGVLLMALSTGDPIKINDARDTEATVHVYNTVLDRYPGDAGQLNGFGVEYPTTGDSDDCEVQLDTPRGDKVDSYKVACDAVSKSATFFLLVSRYAHKDVKTCHDLLAAAPSIDDVEVFRVTVDCRSSCELPSLYQSSCTGVVLDSYVPSAPPGEGLALIRKGEDVKAEVDLFNTIIDAGKNGFAVKYRKYGNDVDTCTILKDVQLHQKFDSYSYNDFAHYQIQCDLFGRAKFKVIAMTEAEVVAQKDAIEDKRCDDLTGFAMYIVHVDCKRECNPLTADVRNDGTGGSWHLEQHPPAGGVVCEPPDVCLTNADFATGTCRIVKSGRYVLTEDISFDPNPPADPNDQESVLNCCTPTNDQLGSDYDPQTYGIGFFAAITIEADDVEIDLAGHRLEQSKRHALLQRFFSGIELANSPFIVGQGPHDFGSSFRGAANVHIHGGVIGRSSHHGIHGNGNRNVLIENVRFEDFEVAAAALNGVDGLVVESCTATSRKDVPVKGTYNAAILLRPFCKAADEAQVSLLIQGVDRTAKSICDDLDASIYNVYKDVITDDGFINKEEHPAEYALFHNEFGVIDGNLYGFVCNHMGIAVFGFPWSPDTTDGGQARAQNVTFRNVLVSDLHAAPDETAAMRRGGHSDTIVTDAAGAIVQVRNRHPDTDEPITVSTLNDDASAVYVGNAMSNAQVVVAKAKLQGMISASRSKIPQAVVDFVEYGLTLHETLVTLIDGEDLTDNTNGYVCNIDSVGHVNKGIIAFKMDAVEGITMENCRAEGVINTGRAGSDVCGGDYGPAISKATYSGYGGADNRAFSFARSENVILSKSTAKGIQSAEGMCTGVDVHTDTSSICLDQFSGENIVAHGYLSAADKGNMIVREKNAYGVRLGPHTHSVSVQGLNSDGLKSNVGDVYEMKNLGGEVVESSCPFLAMQE